MLIGIQLNIVIPKFSGDNAKNMKVWMKDVEATNKGNDAQIRDGKVQDIVHGHLNPYAPIEYNSFIELTTTFDFYWVTQLG